MTEGTGVLYCPAVSPASHFCSTPAVVFFYFLSFLSFICFIISYIFLVYFFHLHLPRRAIIHVSSSFLLVSSTSPAIQCHGRWTRFACLVFYVSLLSLLSLSPRFVSRLSTLDQIGSASVPLIAFMQLLCLCKRFDIKPITPYRSASLPGLFSFVFLFSLFSFLLFNCRHVDNLANNRDGKGRKSTRQKDKDWTPCSEDRKTPPHGGVRTAKTTRVLAEVIFGILQGVACRKRGGGRTPAALL